MSDDDEDRLYETISRLIKTSLQASGCSDMHFAFVVWCECVDGPICAYTDDDNSRRLKFMLNDAAEKMSRVTPTVNMEGHA